MTELQEVGKEIISLTKWCMDDLDSICECAPQRKRLDELKKDWIWECEIKTECRRRMTQWGKWNKVVSSEDPQETFFSTTDFFVFGKDNSAKDVTWFMSEPYGKPRQMKINVEIRNLRRKQPSEVEGN